MAVRPEALRPEYRSAEHQLVYVRSGNGTRSASFGTACYCTNLYDGENVRWERYDFQGEVKPENLPQWAREKVKEVQKKETRKNVSVTGGALMEKRVNQGYEIVQSIEVGTSEFVLGVSQYHPEQFVTWKCSGKTDYYWGHYTDSQLKATKDLCERALEEIAYLEQREQRKGTKREIQKTEQER